VAELVIEVRGAGLIVALASVLLFGAGVMGLLLVP
jgi:hypothetical protein